MARALLISIVTLALAASPALADKGGKGKAKVKEKGKSTKVVVKDKDKDAVLVFVDRDRDLVRTYFVDTHGRGKCPPGLAKKANGCLPPGQAKKRYVIGQVLSPMIVIQPLPVVLETRLGPPPAGYRYAVVDGDVVKLALGTLLVVDAIAAWVD